jgi:two-component system osmolarity sensor histidine kinase EnvZ
MSWRRFDSLFARALLTQTLVVIGLMLVFGVFVYVERNAALGRLVGERWAPALRHAAGWNDALPTALPPVMQRANRPPLAVESLRLSPRMAALDDELRRRGVPVQETLIARGAGAPALWLLVDTPNGAPVWLGVTDEALLPSLPRRIVPAVLLTLMLLVGSSWVLMRRLTRPLELLRARIESHRPGAPRAAGGDAPHVPLPGASPEVAAIESAYADLLARYEGHERERALLLAGVSHDLRSPLARIRMAAGLLPEADGVTPRRDAIVRNAVLLERLIESFLDHVRAGELALDQTVDIAELARTAAARLERAAHEVAVEAPASLVVAGTHPLLIERMLSNLLDNAFAHGQAPVRLRLSATGRQAVIEVVDAGAGIPAGQREAVLQAFARGDASRGSPGTGLGLAIVMRIVSRMGGTLSFDRVDAGHCVRVSLPLAP